jgi:hypothetical protein
MIQIRAAAECAHTGSLYDFLRNDLAARQCGDEHLADPSTDGPGAA